MAEAAPEPLRVAWPGGEATAGYLGARRFRIRGARGATDLRGPRAAAGALLALALEGVSPGREAQERSPLELTFGAERASLVRDPRKLNGWTFLGPRSRFDLDDLQGALADWLRSHAEQAWAVGVAPARPTPLGPGFAYEAFAQAGDPSALCLALGQAIAARLEASPDRSAAILTCIEELRALGHDLWSWDTDRSWGASYTGHRVGRPGLSIEQGSDEDDEAPPQVSVEFKPEA